ncbi:FAD-binding domain-containing protein [Xylariaceae sp. FL1272]|nr:FAD-binding domain-containing protein [Xylariaceae sp. FL1272]
MATPASARECPAPSNAPWPAGVAVHYPNSDAFKNATERWSPYQAPTFNVSVSPTTEQQVVQIVKAATSNKTPFLATGGRHGYTTTLGKLQGGLSIDLSKMTKIDIDKEAQTVTIGPGVTIGDVIGPILEAGFQMPVGSCFQVGVIGATVGAGVGLFQGLFGLMIDALQSVTLVTATGDVIRASSLENAELFFGIRGAGANFGIITSATYHLTKAVNGGQVLTADLIFPASLKSQYFDTLKTFEDMPAQLAVNTAITWNPDTNSTQIIGTFAYSGPEDEGLALIKPFLDLKPPVVRQSVVPYSQVPHVILFGMIAALGTPGTIHDIWTANVLEFSVDTLNSAFDQYDTFFRANPDIRGSVGILESFSTQAVKASEQDTAYPWRDSKGNFMFQMSFPQSGGPAEEAANKFARSLRDEFASTSGYNGLAVYVSYAHGDETLEEIYGPSLPRLVALKKKWDPDNVFGYNNALPTEMP